MEGNIMCKTKVYLELEGVIVDKKVKQGDLKGYLTAPLVPGARWGLNILGVHYDVAIVSTWNSDLEKAIKETIAESLGATLVTPDEIKGIHVTQESVELAYGDDKKHLCNFKDWFSLLDALVVKQREVESIFPE